MPAAEVPGETLRVVGWGVCAIESGAVMGRNLLTVLGWEQGGSRGGGVPGTCGAAIGHAVQWDRVRGRLKECMHTDYANVALRAGWGCGASYLGIAGAIVRWWVHFGVRIMEHMRWDGPWM